MFRLIVRAIRGIESVCCLFVVLFRLIVRARAQYIDCAVTDHGKVKLLPVGRRRRRRRRPTLNDCLALGVRTEAEALDFIGCRLKQVVAASSLCFGRLVRSARPVGRGCAVVAAAAA